MAFVVWAVRYHLEWFIRRKDPQPVEEQKSISECGENRKLDELLDQDQVMSPGDTLEDVLDRNRPKEELIEHRRINGHRALWVLA